MNKYAGVVVPLGVKSEDRVEYLQIARESSQVRGHSDQLETLVLAKPGRVIEEDAENAEAPEPTQQWTGVIAGSQRMRSGPINGFRFSVRK